MNWPRSGGVQTHTAGT